MRGLLLFLVAALSVSTYLDAHAQWQGNDSGLCPNGRWVQSPIPGGGMGARCVPNEGPIEPPPPPPSRIPHEQTAHVGYFGAIAFSPSDGAMGWSYDASTWAAADQRALQGCSNHSAACRVVVRLNAACGAVAVGGNGGWGADTGSDSATAQHNAVVACHNYGNSNCRAIRWVCSSQWDGVERISCGNHTCTAGNKCSMGGGCIPVDAVDCGANKGYCAAGQKCSRDGKACLAWDAVDCGGGKSCPVGHLCIKGGVECLTPMQISEREAAERRRKEEEAARLKREAEERREAARQKDLERQQEIARKKREEEEKAAAIKAAKEKAAAEKAAAAKAAADKAAAEKAAAAKAAAEKTAADTAAAAVQQAAGRPCAQTAPAPVGQAVTIGTPTDITTALKQAQDIYNRMATGGTAPTTSNGVGTSPRPTGSSGTTQLPNNCYVVTPRAAGAVEISQNGKAVSILTPVQLKFLTANPVNLTPAYPPASNPPSSAVGINAGMSAATVTGFSAAKPPPQTPNLWGRIGNSIQFANKSVADDPNFQTGAKDLRMSAAIAGIGCIVGGAIGAAGAGVAALPGCVGGAELFTGVYGAGSTGIAVADGLLTAIGQHQYGQGVTEVVQTAAENFADNPSPLGGIASGMKVGGSWGTYFLYGMYNNVPMR
jgi:Domain of unknown function (DUF4189)